jgi:hypothetical protein
MLAQFAPFASQRCHDKVYAFGAPFQVPRVPKSLCPTCTVPLILGGALFAGSGLKDDWTTALGTVDEKVVPPAFLASTSKRTVIPTSADASVYLEPWAPPMSVQFPPLLSQRVQK